MMTSNRKKQSMRKSGMEKILNFIGENKLAIKSMEIKLDTNNIYNNKPCISSTKLSITTLSSNQVSTITLYIAMEKKQA